MNCSNQQYQEHFQLRGYTIAVLTLLLCLPATPVVLWLGIGALCLFVGRPTRAHPTRRETERLKGSDPLNSLKGEPMSIRSGVPTFALAAACIVLLVSPNLYADHMAVKINLMSGVVASDLTAQTATVTWKHTGTNTPDPCSVSFRNPDPITFVLGSGASEVVPSALCRQDQSSEWNVKGDLNEGYTYFDLSSQTGGTGFVESVAKLPDHVKVPGTSESTTTFEVSTYSVTPATARINADGTKDDASVGMSGADGVAEAGGRLAFSLDGAVVLLVETLLRAEDGGSATIVTDDGLRLFAHPGQLASFSVIATNSIVPTESFSWSALFDGTDLFTTAIGIPDPFSDFMAISDGFFLAYDLMPARDLAATLGPGQVAFDGSAIVVVAVSEPPAWLLVGTGILVFFWFSWRRRALGSNRGVACMHARFPGKK